MEKVFANKRYVKIGNAIEWDDLKAKKNKRRTGVVSKVLTNSVIVAIDGSEDKTVVSHKRYTILGKEAMYVE